MLNLKTTDVMKTTKALYESFVESKKWIPIGVPIEMKQFKTAAYVEVDCPLKNKSVKRVKLIIMDYFLNHKTPQS